MKAYLNAGPKAVVLQRTDGKEWDLPLFVNCSPEAKAMFLDLLGKGADKPDSKATNTIIVEVHPSWMVEDTIKSGPNAGSEILVIKIGDNDDDTVELAEFMSAVNSVTERRKASAAELKTIDEIRKAYGLK